MNKFFHLSSMIVLAAITIIGCEKSPDEAVSISGTISAASGNVTDADVNDPNAPYSVNNTPDEAQVLPNPVTVGGFVAMASKVSVGRLANSNLGDISDYYSLTLLKGQTVTLTIGDRYGYNYDIGIGEDYDPDQLATKPGNLLELYLLDSDRNRIATATSAFGDSDTFSLSAPATGQYYLQVQAITGASDYLLKTDLSVCRASAATASNNSDLRITDEFVPGEIIVKFKSTVSRAPAGVTSSSVAASTGLLSKAGAPGRSMLMSLGDETRRKQALAALGVRSLPTFSDTKTQFKYDTLEAVKALRARDDVEYAKPNYIRRAALVPNDENYNLQWNLPLINLPQAWDVTTGNSDVIVAVIDTGILSGHPDIGNARLVAGFDFIRDPDAAGDGDGIDADPTDPVDFHGTHVTGIVAAQTNNAIGVAGVAWNVRIMPLRVLGAMGGTDYDIEQAVSYAAGLPNDAETAEQTAARVAAGQVADVINMSLGGPSGTAVAPAAYRQAREQGVIIVAAAGNDGSCGLSYPASLQGVVSVSAVDRNKVITDYSNIGETVDVAAPGGTFSDGVYSTWAHDDSGTLIYGYEYLQGTSMASPHVAGVAALMKAVNPGLTPEFFDSLLVSGELTQDLGTPGRDNAYGYGLIDASLAVQAATKDAQELNPTLMLSPSILYVETNVDELQFSATNSGGGELTITLSSGLPQWLTIVPRADVDPTTGLGTYTAKIDRSLLPAQATNGTIVSVSYQATDTQGVVTSGSMDLPVLVYSQSFTSDAGYQYIMLYNAETFDQPAPYPLRTVSVPLSSGQYQYSLTQVPAGRYVITSTSDLNYNFITDRPDAEGSTEIEVGGSDMQGLDFTTGYN